MIHLHLDEAYWCENCQCIIDSSERCPSCANEHDLIPMAQFMPLIRQRIFEISKPLDPVFTLNRDFGKMASGPKEDKQ
jgi:hypothetical protein